MDNILLNAKEVKKLFSEDQVNKYLNNGWKLVYVGQYSEPPHTCNADFILFRTE